MTVANWIAAISAAVIAPGAVLVLRRHVENLGGTLTLTNRVANVLGATVLAPIAVLLSLLVQDQAHTTLAAFSLSILVAALLALAWLDAETMVLPDALTIPLLCAGLVLNLNATFVPLGDAMLGAAIGFLLPWITARGYRLATGIDGLGMGDMKLLAAVGAWLGWMMIPGMLLFAVSMYLAWALIVSGVSKSKGNAILKEALPLGPAIAIAGIVAATIEWPLVI